MQQDSVVEGRPYEKNMLLALGVLPTHPAW